VERGGRVAESKCKEGEWRGLHREGKKRERLYIVGTDMR